MSVTVYVVIITAIAFDFTNGFHDTATAMATSLLAHEPGDGAATAARPIAIACFAVCAAVGAYGIYLLLQK